MNNHNGNHHSGLNPRGNELSKPESVHSDPKWADGKFDKARVAPCGVVCKPQTQWEEIYYLVFREVSAGSGEAPNL